MATSPAASDDMTSSDDAPLDFSMKKRRCETPPLSSSDSNSETASPATPILNGIDPALLASSLLATNAAASSRPFKNYPLSLGLYALPGILTQTPEELYAKFRDNVTKSDDSTSPSSEDQQPSHNKASSRRRAAKSLPDTMKDQAYWERRRKNNEAAKRSRDARRAKEDEIAIRAAFLEQENLKLRVEVAALKNETTKLRHMLYNS